MNQDQFERTFQELKAGKEDIRPSDVVVYSEPLRSALNSALRLGRISLTDLARQLELQRDQAKQIADLLVARNLFRLSMLSNETETYYESRLSSMTRPLSRPPSEFLKKIDD